MSWWSRIKNLACGERLNRELDEELNAHVEAAVAEGRDPDEARRALGSVLRHREESRDIKLIPWLESLRADAVFGWRQIIKRKVTSAAAILSLAVAIGACTSAFRLIDAMLLRPLPVTHPESLYGLAREGLDFDGTLVRDDSLAYPAFQLMRAAVKNQAELLAISFAQQVDVTYKSEEEIEKARLQYVSGWMFDTLGLRPSLGRLLMEDDDRKPGAHPQAVLSHDYWVRRFGRDPQVIGRGFRLGGRTYEIVGVTEQPFTGTEPGVVTDIFVPTMMHPGATRSDWTWFRALARVQPGAGTEPVRAKLAGTLRAFEEERAKGFSGMSKASIDRFLDQRLVLEPAAAGVSAMQRNYRRSLLALGVLVTLVLLIACANVANLMTAEAAARAREMALRVAIGAGRGRLVQLVLLESAWLAFLAAALGALFAVWSAPLVVGMINPPDNPARLSLPADGRVLGFGLALTAGVTLLFGLAPALRASGVKPAGALKGGGDPRTRHRLMHGLIVAQVSFCFLVLFVAGLFVTSFDRLSNRTLGFSPDRLLALDTAARSAQPAVLWEQLAERLRALPGVESVALASRAPLGGGAWNGFVSVNGAPPGPILAYFSKVSPGWAGTMRIPLLEGRDFHVSDVSPGTALINQTFARQFFPNQSPIGKSFAKGDDRYEVVGVVGDVPYRNLREATLPQAYVPFHPVDMKGIAQTIREGTIMVRTFNAEPRALAAMLRHEIGQAPPGFRVSNLRSQLEINQAHTVRERLLARLAVFFAVVALVLAGVGVYGVLDYSVLQRRREIGVRVALGARASHVAGQVARRALGMVLTGAVMGLALGLLAVRPVEALLYQVLATDFSMLAWPTITILGAALLAALPPVIRAIRTDPVKMLRAE